MSSAPSASSAPSPSSNKWALKSALRVLTVILVPCVVMLALNEFTMPLLMMLAPVTPTTPHVAYYPSAHTHEALTDPKLAFFFGGQGIYATSELFKCLTAMESLSKIGGWKGDVYFLISNTYCLPEDVMHKLQNKNVHIVKVDEQNSKSWIPSKQRNEEKMNIKMQILQYIPKDSPIEVVMWYDCDVLFVVPGCVATMIRNKPKITPQNPLFITLGSGIGVHVGSFSASPQHSGPALDLWSDNIVQV
ncbi:hypothetical protein B484DRAFT_424399 [Ochromonadaceae sp. CCMP2298]|nr:hypothetical protein B484DRAFT_424399 [Ochromonadaceae sp. CCMP2298]